MAALKEGRCDGDGEEALRGETLGVDSFERIASTLWVSSDLREEKGAEAVEPETVL
jgi:hypothetical protein